MFNSNEKVMLSFSAGKDAAACLYLLEHYWDRIDVVWCNPGDPYPETVEYMKKIKALVPSFIEVKSDSREWIRQYGYPVDILPIKRTPLGKMIEKSNKISLQSAWDCCGANLWQPMQIFMQEGGYNCVIRGQKSDDRQTSPIRSGQTIEGVRYLFPLEDWTDADVIEYLGDRVPPSYERRKTSLDCMRCTAYMKDNSLSDLEKISPLAAEEVRAVYKQLSADLKQALTFMEM